MKTAQKGFTLVELLVVIAIIAILAAVVVLIVNPAEILKEGRDATRLSDMANLQQAINVASQTTGFTYCNAGATPADPTPCVFTSAAGGAGQTADGNGWVRADLASQTTVKVSALPIDPSNTGTFIYRYCGTDAAGAAGWELNANLESTKYQPKMDNDGGNLSSTAGDFTAARYEVGSSLTICP